MSVDAELPPIEDYALLADLRTGPLVSRDGSIDGLCLPRFDSPAMFSSLLGDPDSSHWLLRPRDGEVVSRAYEDGSFVLRTDWRTPSGRAVVTEFMPASDDRADLVRHVECTEGEVVVDQEFVARFDYGQHRAVGATGPNHSR